MLFSYFQSKSFIKTATILSNTPQIQIMNVNFLLPAMNSLIFVKKIHYDIF